MSIIAMLASALGGSAAAGAGATAGTAAGSTFLGGLMDKGASAISAIGDYASSAADAVGLSDSSGMEQIEQLNKQLQMLQDEAEAIKMGTDYVSEDDRDTDLASNAARTQETQNEIDKLTAKQAQQTSSASLSGTLGGSKGGGKAPSIASGSVSSGEFSEGALTGAAMTQLGGRLGGAPQTTQQQLIMAQNQAFGGFNV